MQLSKFEQIGITKNNLPVYSGTYYFFETHGIPIDVIISLLYSKNIIPSWLDLYKDMIISGVKPTNALSKIEAAIIEGHSQELADYVVSQLNQIQINNI